MSSIFYWRRESAILEAYYWLIFISLLHQMMMKVMICLMPPRANAADWKEAKLMMRKVVFEKHHRPRRKRMHQKYQQKISSECRHPKLHFSWFFFRSWRLRETWAWNFQELIVYWLSNILNSFFVALFSNRWFHEKTTQYDFKKIQL